MRTRHREHCLLHLCGQLNMEFWATFDGFWAAFDVFDIILELPFQTCA
jgi:hypothetical protein